MTSNLFDQVSRIQAGETLGPYALSYSDFPRSAGWSITCLIFGDAGNEATVAADADPNNVDGFLLTIPAATTSAWSGGRKSFVVEASLSGAVYVAERGALTVLWNPRVKTQAMTILESIRSVMAGLATDGQRTVVLDGIQLRNMTPAELEQWEGRYNRIVNAQIGKAGGNGGVYAIKMRTPQDNRYAAPWYGPYPPPGSQR